MSSSNLVKTYYDINRLVIWQDDVSEENGKKARMVFGFRDGNPRITVYTGNTGAESIISFPADIPHMVTIMNYIKDIAVAEPGKKISVESKTSVYENNKPTTEKKVVSTLYIGKSKEGLVYLSVISENKPKYIFTIKTSPYHTFRDNEKNPIPESMISQRMAIGIADLMLNTISNILVQYTNDEYKTGARKLGQIKNAVLNGSVDKNAVKAEMIKDLDDLQF